ncbi:hypothetical protein NVP1084O_209 [Vibrio phage 1.084.O._10N.261.49.F5]|nr:hypothetical protein NVP1084O_209 [Vibrio phage 1.084.O._10N.261.49.F5]
MGVDAKLFVTCGQDKSVEVGKSVANALDFWVRDKVDTYWKENTDCVNRMQFLFKERQKTESSDFKFTNGIKDIDTRDFESYRLHFGCGDENLRMLWMHTRCSCDYSDTYEGEKVIFSIGHWGMCDEIMKVVAEAVKPFGDVYYDHNDCDDEDFVKLFQDKE